MLSNQPEGIASQRVPADPTVVYLE